MNQFQRFYHNELKDYYKKFISENPGKRKIVKDDNQDYKGKFDLVILDGMIGDSNDVYKLLEKTKKHCKPNTTILISYYNHLWEPLLKLASDLGLRKEVSNQNWLDEDDLKNLLDLTGFEYISVKKRIILPLEIPFLDFLFNQIIANIPLINSLCLIFYVTARPVIEGMKDKSVSIIIPARNEAGNVTKIIPSVPKFGKTQEYIFVEGNSTDDTWNKLKEVKKKYKNTKILKQNGKGKANAVWKGFGNATGDILMIYDADMTVDPKDLPRFYKSIKENPNSFINGSRLVYPMENQAMQTLNKMGNKIFGQIFTFILGQRFKDTLCGTKVIKRTDYLFIKKNFKDFFVTDPFGDFVLIFGAVKRNLKVIEVPVKYRERKYGSTNISRFKHGLMLLKMTYEGFKEFKIF